MRDTITAIKSVGRVTANGNSTPVDIQNLDRDGFLILDSTAAEADGTVAIKLQHSDTQGGTYADAGIAFANVEDDAASFQRLGVAIPSLKRWVRAVWTLTGTSQAATFGVYLQGKPKY